MSSHAITRSMQGFNSKATSGAFCKGVHGSGRGAHEVLRREGPSESVPQAPQRVHCLLHDAPRSDAALRLVQPPATGLRQHCGHLLRLPGRLHMRRILSRSVQGSGCTIPTHVLQSALPDDVLL